MNRSTPSRLALLLCVSLLSSCITTAPDSLYPPADCTEGSRWEAGVEAFRDASEDWGLPETGAAGTRLIAVDFDSDGWTDLVVRKNNNADDFSSPEGRTSWLLRNVDGQRFEDVTESSGFRVNREGDASRGRGGEVIAFADVDNDGDLDVYTGFHQGGGPGADTSELLLNDGAGGFVLAEEDHPLRRVGQTDVVAGASFVDVDRDGDVDLWLTQNSRDGQPQQDRLFRGDGAAGFRDVTDDWGLETAAWSAIDDLNEARAHTNSWGAAACDLDDDGRPDLLSSSYGRAPNHLWLNQGERFDNASVESGYAFDHRTDWSDNESARCYCALNPDAGDCAGVPAPQVRCESSADILRWNHQYDREAFRLGGNSGATVCGDLDNDGDLDLLTTEIVHWDVGSSSDPSELLYNDGAARFERPGNEATGILRDRGPGWNDGDITGSLFDFDNDGRLDVYIGATDYPDNIGLLYHQQVDGSFVTVPVEDGVDHRRSHGSAVADFDRDGDLDLVVGHSHGRCSGECYDTQAIRLFENRLGEQGNWVQITLEGDGPAANRAAIGARLTMNAGGLVRAHEVGGGHGHYGMQDDLVAHLGLGEACEVEVSVRWPDRDGTTETATLPAGHRYRWVRGSAPVLLAEEEQ